MNRRHVFFTAAVSAFVVIAGAGGLALPAFSTAAPTSIAVTTGSDRCGYPADRPWCDTRLSANRRANLLVKELTTDEEIGLLAGDELTGVAGAEGTHTGTSDGVERVGLPPVYFSDGPVGTRQGKATGMPSPMNLASTFSRRAARQHARVIGDEVRRKGNDVVYAPTINILRTPVNGRTFEYFGEDPYLTGVMATGWTRGVQSEGVVGNVKHYAVNNQEGQGAYVPGAPIGAGVDGSRMVADAQVSERALREIYLPGFEAAVKRGHVGSVMCSYNRVNGASACNNEHLLEDVLKGDWGFKGFVLTDYGAGKDTVQSMKNGLDLDIWPGVTYDPIEVNAALAAGLITEQDIHEHVQRILRTLFAYGFFDREAYAEAAPSIDQRAHHRAAGRLSSQGMVLLKNRGGVLPLDAKRIDTLAVIGPEADVLRDGGGSSAINEFRLTTPLAALRRALGTERVIYDDGSDHVRAADVARRADAAVVIVGDKMSEGVDKSAPTLNADQTDGIDRDALIGAVGDAQPRTVAVLQSGGPVLTPWRSKVPAIVEMWYPGQNGGSAIADVLLGKVDPGGRLPGTFPRSAEDLPTAGSREQYPGVAGTVDYSEDVLVGYRWFDEQVIQPAFPFGHGLSYTSFRYGKPTLSRGTGDRVAELTFTVTNTGDRRGYAVPQVYVGMPEAADRVQPPRQLKGFRKLALRPGQTREVTIPLGRRAFSYWNTDAEAWRVAHGCYRVQLATSSRHVLDTTTLAWKTSCRAESVVVR